MKIKKTTLSKPLYKATYTAVSLLCLFNGKIQAQSAKLGLDRAAYGVYDRLGASNKTTHPFLNGIEFTTGWETLHTEPEKFVWDPLTAAIKKAYVDGQPIIIRFLPIGLEFGAPAWLTSQGVEMFTDDSGYRYGDYKNPTYLFFLKKMVARLGKHLQSTSFTDAERNNIACVRVEIGATSDPEPFHGTIPEKYRLTSEEWQAFSKETFTAHIKAFQTDLGIQRKLPLRFSTNEASTPGLWNWVAGRAEAGLLGTKFGGEVRGHHLTTSGSSVAEMKPQQVNSTTPIFSMNEMDKTWQRWEEVVDEKGTTKYNLQRMGFYWCAVEQLNGGMSIWDVDGSSLRNLSMGEAPYNDFSFAFTFFNEWAAELVPATARGGFSIFHEGLNSADKVKFSETKYGLALQSNADRYTNICNSAPYAARGAKIDDKKNVVNGHVLQRAAQIGFNDAGWDIVAGNYERFITQKDPDSTSIGRWRVRGNITKDSHHFDRFARSFISGTSNTKMYFDVQDGLTPTPNQSIKLSVTYLDKGREQFSLLYDALDEREKTAFIVTKNNTNTWKTMDIIVTDWRFLNGGSLGSDLILKNLTTTGTTIFHGIELVKLSNVIISVVGQGTVTASNEGNVFTFPSSHETGKRLEMKVTPAVGWKFQGWTGSLTGNIGKQILFPIGKNTRATATFVQK